MSSIKISGFSGEFPYDSKLIVTRIRFGSIPPLPGYIRWYQNGEMLNCHFINLNGLIYQQVCELYSVNPQAQIPDYFGACIGQESHFNCWLSPIDTEKTDISRLKRNNPDEAGHEIVIKNNGSPEFLKFKYCNILSMYEIKTPAAVEAGNFKKQTIYLSFQAGYTMLSNRESDVK